MERISIKVGTKVTYNGISSIIVKILDIDRVSIEEINSNIIHTIPTNLIIPEQQKSKNKDNEIVTLPEKKWELAIKRFNIIKEILESKCRKKIIDKVALENNISVATIYRWLKLYEKSGLVSSLSGKLVKASKGSSRLSKMQDEIVNSKIDSIYLTKQRGSIPKTIREIQRECFEKKIDVPHANTIRNRIKFLSEEQKIKSRYGDKFAREKFNPIKGNFNSAEYPLSIVQIDHTPVDIILVDEKNRAPYQRPWLTMAIDLFSRAVVGFYLSYDPPSALSVGSCIANSILPKEMWLEQMGINANWPCWGQMDNIHIDNAKEFHSNMLKKACLDYGINIMYRPVATPHYGGHIERLLGTFAREIHNLPGTTFSSEADKKNYDSQKNASLSLSEFERWLTIFITKVYHNRIHSSISDTPINKFKLGILGSNTEIGKGIPPRIFDERRVRLDFMPYIERTIQEYGLVNDHIHYYHDILRPYINSTDTKGNKIKYLFRTDPRDISVVYFFEPNTKEYHEIPYRNTSLPPISIWEYRDVIKKLKYNQKTIDESSIFDAYRELEELEYQSKRKTKKQKVLHKKQNGEVLKSKNNIENKKYNIIIENNIFLDEVNKNKPNTEENNHVYNIEPFEDIDI